MNYAAPFLSVTFKEAVQEKKKTKTNENEKEGANGKHRSGWRWKK